MNLPNIILGSSHMLERVTKFNIGLIHKTNANLKKKVEILWK